MAGKVFRGGVFGFGGMGQEMTTRINFDRWYGEDVQIVAACNRGEPNRKIAKERFALNAYEDPRDLLKEDLDFALITSTTVAHYEHVCLCAEAGLPMLVEKPIALTIKEAKHMLELVKQRKLQTVVNFGRRFQPEYRKLKDMVASGMFGDLLSIEGSVYRGAGTFAAGTKHRAVLEPEESGGWTVHHACHIVDIICWYFGEVDEVTALTRSTYNEKFSEEVVLSTLKFKNGALGHAFDTVGGVPGTQLALVGSLGGAALDHGGGVPLVKLRVKGDRTTGAPRLLDPRETHKYVDPINHLFDLLRNGGESIASVFDAFYSLQVTMAMRQSAMNGGKAVKVDSVL